MPKQVFSTFWHGKALPPLHWACLASFPARGHRLRLFCYDPVEVPKGVELADASSVIDRSEVFEFAHSFSGFSNIFRYALLLREGCWWVDTDVYCLGSDIPDCAYAWAHQDVNSINGAILKFPAGDPTLRGILDESRQIGRNVTAWGKLGPGMLSRHLHDRSFPGHFGSTQAFYPIHWLETFRFWLPGQKQAVWKQADGACLLHLWASMFGRFGIDLWREPPAGSFLQEMYAEAGYPRALRPALPTSSIESARAGITAYLAQKWTKEASQRALGHDLSAKLLADGWPQASAVPPDLNAGASDG